MPRDPRTDTHVDWNEDLTDEDIAHIEKNDPQINNGRPLVAKKYTRKEAKALLDGITPRPRPTAPRAETMKLVTVTATRPTSSPNL